MGQELYAWLTLADSARVCVCEEERLSANVLYAYFMPAWCRNACVFFCTLCVARPALSTWMHLSLQSFLCAFKFLCIACLHARVSAVLFFSRQPCD